MSDNGVWDNELQRPNTECTEGNCDMYYVQCYCRRPLWN